MVTKIDVLRNQQLVSFFGYCRV